MPVQPRTPQGVLELLPAQQIAFQRMLDTTAENFELFGFLPGRDAGLSSSPDVLLTKVRRRDREAGLFRPVDGLAPS